MRKSIPLIFIRPPCRFIRGISLSGIGLGELWLVRRVELMEDGLHRSRKRNELLFGVEIDEDKDGGPRTDAAVDFDAVRDRTEDGGDAANVDHPLRKRGHEIGIEDGADIGDASLAEGMSDDAGLAVEPPVAASVA